jgi:hypothetical protein
VIVYRDATGDPKVASADGRIDIRAALAWATKHAPEMIAEEKADTFRGLPEEFVVRACASCSGSGKDSR